MTIKASSKEGKEGAKRLEGVVRSLVRTGFINRKELPRTMTDNEARALIFKVTSTTPGAGL